MAWRKEILFQRWSHLTNKYIFWGPREILVFGRDTKIGETLDEVYRVKRWLYWKIKLLFIKKPLFDSRKITHLLPRPCTTKLRQVKGVSWQMSLGNSSVILSVYMQKIKIRYCKYTFIFIIAQFNDFDHVSGSNCVVKSNF